MKIAINALTIRHGGSLVALQKLLSGFVELRPAHEYHLIASSALRKAMPDDPKLHIHYFAWAERYQLLTVLWYLIVLPFWLKRHQIDVLHSHTSYLPVFGVKRSALLLQDARFFVAERNCGTSSVERVSFLLKKGWAHLSVRIADAISVQSNTQAASIAQSVPGTSAKIRVIRHGPGILDNILDCAPLTLIPGRPLELIYVAYFWAHKNFSVLLRALRILHDRQIPVRLHLTLDLNRPGVAELLSEAEKMGVADAIVNHGEVGAAAVTQLYRQSHLALFPSVCESFGFPQVEAMAFGLQLIAADTPVNREICQNAAIYFSPHDAARLADIIARFYLHPADLISASRVSLARAAVFDWRRAVRETLSWLEADGVASGSETSAESALSSSAAGPSTV
jgi:glycosyltransferase involved in cell wall biosynthesis